MTIPTLRSDSTIAFLLAALAVVAITVLSALHVPAPDVLSTVALVAAAGALGNAIPRVTPTAATVTPAAATPVTPAAVTVTPTVATGPALYLAPPTTTPTP